MKRISITVNDMYVFCKLFTVHVFFHKISLVSLYCGFGVVLLQIFQIKRSVSKAIKVYAFLSKLMFDSVFQILQTESIHFIILRGP